MEYKIIKVFLLSIMFIFVANQLSAEKQQYLYNQILRIDGLKNNKVTDIVKDADGTYWIGTQSGLNRIVEGTVVNNTDYSEFENKQINYIFKDSLNQIWVSSEENKLYLYEIKSGKFKRAEFEGNEFYARSYILLKGGILFNNADGLYKYEYSNHKIKRINLTQQRFWIRSIAQIDDVRIAIMDSKNNIYVLDLKTLKLKHLSGVSLADYRIIRNFFIDSKQRIWIPVYGNGLLCYSIDDEGKLLKHINAQNSGENVNIVLDIIEYNKELWLSTDGGGVILINVDDFGMKQFENDLSSHIAGQIRSSMTVYIDDVDDIWVGTVRNGLINMKGTYIQGFNLRKLYKWRDGLSSSTIVNIIEDDKNNIWLGVDDDGLACYTPSTNQFKHIKSTAGLKVTNIVEVDSDYILISVYNGSLYRVNKHTEELTPIVIINEDISNTIRNYDISTKLVKIDSKSIFVIANKVYI